MPYCPRCQSPNAIFTEKDKWGIWEVCIYCGWEKFIKSQSQKSFESELKEPQKLRRREPFHYSIGLG